MVMIESVTIKVLVGMSKYLNPMNAKAELTGNSLLLYPYILNQTISHEGAAEILDIRNQQAIRLCFKDKNIKEQNNGINRFFF